MTVILEQFSLKGKTALVTGGARGLGEAMAPGLAEAGADVAVAAASGAVHAAADKIRALGPRSLAIQSDLSSIEPISDIMTAVLEHFGRLDILINCAGVIRRAPALNFFPSRTGMMWSASIKRRCFFCARRRPGS